ncbi:biotin synthase BioB [Alteribacillus bidgolensis]|uniref:Biotin synthase n=1 Tax=Alteribacillus bidgolensis TaxID=930129 RepID=A0A1G8G6Z5_9BACI|nr:biotin synthase BioB [Alteribacillus bidgolensis]SDH90164.1 biotin synthase [Alteribacillus bidgolensis]
MNNSWNCLADEVLQGKKVTKQDGLNILSVPDRDILSLLNGAYKLRYHYYANDVKLNMIVNAKSGLCPEDCGYCAQSSIANTDADKYPLLDKDSLVKGAKEAMERKAGTYCIVASGRGPTEKEVDHVTEAVKEIKQEMPLKICACLGILKEGQAERLKAAGVDRYNHNLNTHKDHHAAITTTHTYEDRERTVNHAKNAGISPCSGVIAGMGETDEQLIETLFALKELDADSVPVNFLHPVKGTPLEDRDGVAPMRSLKILAAARYILPDKEIRVSGGREVNIRSLQPLTLYAANSIFVGDYLTTGGQKVKDDHQMIEDMGFRVEQYAVPEPS